VGLTLAIGPDSSVRFTVEVWAGRSERSTASHVQLLVDSAPTSIKGFGALRGRSDPIQQSSTDGFTFDLFKVDRSVSTPVPRLHDVGGSVQAWNLDLVVNDGHEAPDGAEELVGVFIADWPGGSSRGSSTWMMNLPQLVVCKDGQGATTATTPRVERVDDGHIAFRYSDLEVDEPLPRLTAAGAIAASDAVAPWDLRDCGSNTTTITDSAQTVLSLNSSDAVLGGPQPDPGPSFDPTWSGTKLTPAGTVTISSARSAAKSSAELLIAGALFGVVASWVATYFQVGGRTQQPGAAEPDSLSDDLGATARSTRQWQWSQMLSAALLACLTLKWVRWCRRRRHQ
jgi:hypothetical protein